ncbi:MAG: protein-tyrosine phosphatase, partial [Actinomycetota bacterium]|nr:protein-tyrosine phosphatase [Actinomycetota bacterium]
MPFEACFNFRDIGGYETADGRRVRWGSVFRSDTLHRLTTADLERARELGVRTVIDLRSVAELAATGRFGRDDVAFHHLPLEEKIPSEPPDPETPEPPPGEIYVEMATTGRRAVANTLRVIAEGEHAVVFHCTA